MNNELRTIAILFGQMISTILILLMIWVWGDTEVGKKAIAFLLIDAFFIKVLVSILILLLTSISLYKNLKSFIKSEPKDKGDE